jgi:hypothetical protein
MGSNLGSAVNADFKTTKRFNLEPIEWFNLETAKRFNLETAKRFNLEPIEWFNLKTTVLLHFKENLEFLSESRSSRFRK